MKKEGTGKDILILYNSVEYFIDCFERRNVIAKRPYKEVSFSLGIIRKLCRLLRLPDACWYGDWERVLTTTKTLIVFAPLKMEVLEYINKNNRNIRIIYWHWNPTFRIGLPDNKLWNITEIWSFDPEDCRRFGMNFNTTFYFKDILLPDNRIEYDAIFLGVNKGRRMYLLGLESRLNRNGIKTYFHIVPDLNKGKWNKLKPIPYSEYLEIVSKSKAIVDIIPNGQTGLTLRPMESIFLKKKLITNDLTIVLQDFYKKQNIFIIGQDEEADLKAFIDSPYVEVEDSILERYDFSDWIERFNA